ncbi:MAG: serine hydrolase [Candidatus Roizmanbacteria bacterium]|nr:serine hydrolase [Candidatus Roizmanbacteria bacterium]
MTLLRIVVFLTISFLLLFYPGNYWLTHVFSQHELWKEKPVTQFALHTIPVVNKNAPYPPISAEGAYIADLSSFTPVFERNSNQKMYPASTAKIITALVTIDLFKPTDVIVVTKQITKDEQPDWQLMGLVTGEKMTVENLLYGTLVYSANDAAFTLANAYGYDRFIEKMNAKAAELGMTNSHFKNPIGIDDYEQLTTPRDLALAARALLKDTYLAKFVSTKEITISDTDYKYFHRLNNVNELLGKVVGIGGLKTGYTELAGQNLVSFYKKNGNQYIIVVLKSLDRFADTQSITQWIDQYVEHISMPIN